MSDKMLAMHHGQNPIPPAPEPTAFAKLAALNCNEHIEKKSGFSYLSWPWAVKKLREISPTATWNVVRFDGLPYLKTECGFFVEVAVTVDGITLSQIHPVLDHRNQPIAAPNGFQINTSIQRCLVKAISLHGLGLYVYAGEDLPEGDHTPEPAKPTKATPPTDTAPSTVDSLMAQIEKAGTQDDLRAVRPQVLAVHGPGRDMVADAYRARFNALGGKS